MQTFERQLVETSPSASVMMQLLCVKSSPHLERVAAGCPGGLPLNRDDAAKVFCWSLTIIEDGISGGGGLCPKRLVRARMNRRNSTREEKDELCLR